MENLQFFLFFRILSFRLPRKEPMRQQWIDNIKKHQRFSTVDANSLDYSVCSEHFCVDDMVKSNNRLHARGLPTIFPTNSASAPNAIPVETIENVSTKNDGQNEVNPSEW